MSRPVGTLTFLAVHAQRARIALAILATTVGGASAQEPADEPMPAAAAAPIPFPLPDAPAITADNVAAFFDAAFEIQRRDHEMVGAVVSVVYRGEVLFQRGYGWADLEERQPADPERSLFRIASITKTFVWTALMQLVEEGRVDLEAPVDRYLDFPIPATYEEPIRVWHLMTHTPGLEETWTGWGARDADEVGDLGEKLQELMPARVRPPGKHAAYSNYGAALAGYIVERVSGQPWDAYVEEHILRPLGMASTHAATVMPPDLEARHAKGYRWRQGRFVASDYTWSQLPPAGHMSSTAADMARFMLAHLHLGALGDARILEEETARTMQSPLFQPHPDLAPLLHGFYRSDRNGQVIFGHGGDTNQFHSNMSLFPELGLGVFVSFNSDPAAAARSSLVRAFVERFFPTEPLRQAPEPADSELAEYTGRYLPLRAAFTSFERLGQLFGSGPTAWIDGNELRFGNEGRWVPLGDDRFTGLYEDGAAVFERDGQGRITHVMVGSPLSTLRKVELWEDPDFLQALVAAVGLIFGVAVLGWGYRAFRRAPEEKRLPTHHVRLAWLYAALTLFLVAAVPAAASDTYNGSSGWLRAAILAVDGSVILGLLVVVFAARQWSEGYGGRWARLRYSVVALASLVTLWFAWSFNLVGYPP